MRFFIAFSVIAFERALADEECHSTRMENKEILNCVAVSQTIIDGMMSDSRREVLGRKGFKYKPLRVS